MPVLRSTALAVLTAVLVAGPPELAHAQGEPDVREPAAVTWKVKDRFRLFDRADANARARVEAALTVLSSAAPGDTSAAIRPHYDLLLDTLAGPEAASLRRSNWRWARNTDEVGRRTYEPTYLYPATYTIEARLAGVGGDCRWTINGQPAAVAPCGDPVTLEVSAGADAGRWGARATLAVDNANGERHETLVEITDRLVVAMGDSFSSGEGNPDVPSRIDPRIPPGPDFRRPDWLASDEARPYVQPAEWWDEPCHRSLLSWPVLAAFWHAAQDDQAAVTLVHVGCSGAEENDGLNLPQRDLPGGGDETKSQADQVRALLAAGPGRPIDNVLMSLGGNDVGFVPVISYAVLPPNGYGWGPLDVIPALAVGGVGGAIPPYETRDALPLWALGPWRASAETRLRELPERLDRVAATFAGWGVAPGKVTHTLYPNILVDDRGDYCRTVLTEADLEAWPETSAYRLSEAAYRARNLDDERGGFEALLSVMPWFAKLRTNWNFQFQYYPDLGAEGCDPDQTLASDSEVCKAEWVWRRLNAEVARSRDARGWRVADAHVEATVGHGWCVSPNDSLRMPVSVFVDGEWRWSPDSPAAFRPYREDLGRWFRTTNDSVRTQWSGADRMIQGTIHPSYNMHIAYAEAAADAAFAER